MTTKKYPISRRETVVRYDSPVFQYSFQAGRPILGDCGLYYEKRNGRIPVQITAEFLFRNPKSDPFISFSPKYYCGLYPNGERIHELVCSNEELYYRARVIDNEEVKDKRTSPVTPQIEKMFTKAFSGADGKPLMTVDGVICVICPDPYDVRKPEGYLHLEKRDVFRTLYHYVAHSLVQEGLKQAGLLKQQ